MKKILALFLAVSMMFSLVACGGSEGGTNTDNQGNRQTQQGGTKTGTQQGGQAPAVSLSSTSADNYKDIVKQYFGLDIIDEGWTVTTAKSPNGVNNVDLVFTIPAGTDGEAEIEKYFNQEI